MIFRPPFYVDGAENVKINSLTFSLMTLNHSFSTCLVYHGEKWMCTYEALDAYKKRMLTDKLCVTKFGYSKNKYYFCNLMIR